MHVITLFFVCIELLLLTGLLMYRLARPDYSSTMRNLILVFLLLVYNIAGGLLPDENLPMSVTMQNCIAYGTGFITPSYFPYYVYREFHLKDMHFHAFKGIYVFLVFPYVLFVLIYLITGQLNAAKYILVIPALYAVGVIVSLIKAIRSKYRGSIEKRGYKEEVVVLVFSLASWMFLPVIDFFGSGQVVEAVTTNLGFLLLLSLQIKTSADQIKAEHEKLLLIERRLSESDGIISKIPNRFEENCDNFLLTRREKEIAAFICNGYSYKKIAETLFISQRTVSKHVEHIFEKVQVNNKIELINKIAS